MHTVHTVLARREAEGFDDPALNLGAEKIPGDLVDVFERFLAYQGKPSACWVRLRFASRPAAGLAYDAVRIEAAGGGVEYEFGLNPIAGQRIGFGPLLARYFEDPPKVIHFDVQG